VAKLQNGVECIGLNYQHIKRSNVYQKNSELKINSL